MRVLAALAAGLMLGGAAAAYDSAERFETKNICTFVAGVTSKSPPEIDRDDPVGRLGMFDRDGLVRQGIIDLDGDGNFETIKNGDMGHHGGDFFDIQKADGESVLEGGIVGAENEPSGMGAGFTNFYGRWYLVITSSEGGSFPRGVYSFEKGTLKRKLECRFESDVTQTMVGARGANSEDEAWCASAPSEAAANRLKPTIALTEAQEKALTAAYEEATGPYAGNTTYHGTEIFEPKSGPFAGKTLWRVQMDSDAGRGCSGTAFELVQKTASGGYELVSGPDQDKLIALQSGESGDAVHCGVFPELFEANGRFFLERTSGDTAPTDDTMLAHSIAEWTDGTLRETCRAEYEVTPRVTWANPDLPQ